LPLDSNNLDKSIGKVVPAPKHQARRLYKRTGGKLPIHP